MSNGVIITFIILFVPILFSRFMMEKELKKLDAEMKVKLLDGFSNQRKYMGFVMLPIMLVYLFLLKMFPEYSLVCVGIFALLFIVYFIWSRRSNFRKIKELGAPEAYVNAFRNATIMVALGFLAVGVQIVLIFMGIF